MNAPNPINLSYTLIQKKFAQSFSDYLIFFYAWERLQRTETEKKKKKNITKLGPHNSVPLHHQNKLRKKCSWALI